MPRFVLLSCLVLLLGSCSLFRGERQIKAFPGGEPDDFEAHDRQLSEYERIKPAQKEGQKIIIPSDRETAEGAKLTVVINDDHVTAGTVIRIKCQVLNVSSNAVQLTYTTAQRFDIVAYKDTEQKDPVYLWSKNQVFTQLFSQRTLNPGANLTNYLDVPTVATPVSEALLPDDLSRPLTPGTYYLWVTHAGTPYLATGPIEVTVEAAPESK